MTAAAQFRQSVFKARWLGAWLGVLALACGTDSAIAGQSCDLRELASVEMTLDDVGRPLVPVAIAGVPKVMMLDTGGAISTLTQKTFEELGTTPLRRNDIVMTDVRGDRLDKSVIVPSVTIGHARGNAWRFWIHPPDVDLGSKPGKPIAGTLASDLLSKFDVDLDFPHQTVKLFSQNHCPGKILYWTPTLLAIIPFDLSADGHITIPVTVDGKRVRAMVDTGAHETLMNLTVAQRRFELDATATADDTVHQFKSLELEGLRVENPLVRLRRDAMANAMTFNSGAVAPAPRQGFPDLLIGQNVIGKFHVYIAYRERNLYVTN